MDKQELTYLLNNLCRMKLSNKDIHYMLVNEFNIKENISIYSKYKRYPDFDEEYVFMFVEYSPCSRIVVTATVPRMVEPKYYIDEY